MPVTNTFKKFLLVAVSACGLSGMIQANELAPDVHLSDVLSPKLLQSVNHRVDDVQLDGSFYRFLIESDFGSYDIGSLAMLHNRIDEITTLGQAISQFSSKNERLSDELRGQLHISADSAIDILARPVSSAANIAGQLAENLGDTLSGVPGVTKESVYYDATESADPTTMMHKRNVASQWQLDVYSTNPQVQKFLNTVAKTRSSGRISAGAPSIGKARALPFKIADADLELDIAYLLKSKNVDELDFINDQILQQLGVKADLRESFIKHPAFSPRHKTKIAHYLGTLSDTRNLSAFIQSVLNTEGERSALAAEQAAIMLSYYHREIDNLQTLRSERKLLQAMTASKHLVNFLPADFTYWSKSNEILFDKIANNAQQSGFQSWELVSSGSLSDQAKQELEKRQFSLKQRFIY